jgi:hypothetical protein
MRIPIVMAYAAGMGQQIINSIPNVRFVPTGPQNQMPGLFYTKNGNEYEFTIRKIAVVSMGQQSLGAGGKWKVVLLTPMSMDWDVGPRAHRKLKRFIDNTPSGYLMGPKSIAQMAEEYPAFAGDYLMQNSTLIAPHHLAGDPSPARIAEIDYRPSSLEAFDDIEPERTDLFGPDPEPPEI